MSKRGTTAPRTALTAEQLRAAKQNLIVMKLRTIEALDPPLHGENILFSLFEQDTIEVCKKAYQFISEEAKHQSTCVTYSVDITAQARVGFPEDVWKTAEMVAPRSTACIVSGNEVLKELVSSVQEIQIKYRVAEYVLDWFNNYGSRGAMRHYWPAILKLLPLEAGIFDRKSFTVPHGMGIMLEHIRSSAVTIASGCFLRSMVRALDSEKKFFLHMRNYDHRGIHVPNETIRF